MALTTRVNIPEYGTITYTTESGNYIITATPSLVKKYVFQYWLVDDSDTQVTTNPLTLSDSTDHVVIAYFKAKPLPYALYDDKEGHVGVCLGSMAIDARDKVVSELPTYINGDATLNNTAFRRDSTITVIDDSDPTNVQTVTKEAYEIFTSGGIQYVDTDTNYANTIRIMSGAAYSEISPHDIHTLYFLSTIPNNQ